MIVVIDNYDSFVHNLARYVRQLTDEPMQVVRNDELDFDVPVSYTHLTLPTKA